MDGVIITSKEVLSRLWDRIDKAEKEVKKLQATVKRYKKRLQNWNDRFPNE